MFKGFVIESMPPFSLEIKSVKIDEFINISPSLDYKIEL
jgi:hypothetical protein